MPEIPRPPPEEVSIFAPEEKEEEAEAVPEILTKGTPFLLENYLRASIFISIDCFKLDVNLSYLSGRSFLHLTGLCGFVPRF